jgi:type IV secretory pathway TraG/TraD family ATPase VirD4
MSLSNETTLNRATDPLAPLEHLAQWLVGTAVHVALGVLLGLLAARAMRRCHLHWSWAAGAFALVLLVRSVLAANTAMLGVATLCAAIRGRRWHGEDLDAGADLAEIAAARTTPLDGLRACAHGARSQLASGRAARERGGRAWRGDRLSIGADSRGRLVSIELGGAGGGTHTLVVGAAGSGKTFTQTWIAMQAIAYGMSAIIVDPKGDRGMRERIRRAALATGRRFIVWTPQGPSVYNPYACGGETEIADKALAGERFTEPHYQRQAQRYLGHAVRALRAGGREVSLAALVDTLNPERLELLARELSRSRGTRAFGASPRFGRHDAQAVHAYLDSLTTRQRGELSGVRDRLAIMAESDVGPWLDPTTADAECFELLSAVRTGAVVYFSLNADSRPLLAQMLGSAIVQDLQTVVSALQERPVRCLVVIDEFSAISAEHIASLFARARAAGISLLLGTQELADLRLPGHEILQEQVLGNLTSLIAHRQVVPSSAELIARLSGSRGAWRTSVSSDGRSTRTRVSEPLIGSEEVASLPRGCAAAIRLASPRSASIAQMHSPDLPL